MWADALTQAMIKGEINTPRRCAAFLGQVSVESMGFTHLTENLNYSAPRLRKVWPKRFPNDATAEAYAHNPEKLANYVYASRLGNGDAASGDGWLFRGGGLIQTTGRFNYEAYGKMFGMTAEEAAVEIRKPTGAAQSAVYFWVAHNLNELADDWDIDAISIKVNGGSNGITEREEASQAALEAEGGT